MSSENARLRTASSLSPQSAASPRRDAVPPADRPKVVYIMGTGRSGSTILGITLGNCADIFYAGELHLWLGKDGRSPLPGAAREQLWSAVREHVAADLSGSEARSLEQSTAVLRVRGWRSRRRLRKRYRRIAEELCQAIARAAAVTHVVDSSHFPRRAREMQALTGIDLYLILLARDPRGVVASYSDDDRVFPRFNVLTTNVYMWLTYLLSLLVFLRQPRNRRVLVRYEQFVSDPERILRDIFEIIESPASVPDLTSLETGLAFQGNPVLATDVVALRRQPAKRVRGSRITTLLQLPWLAVCSRLRPRAGAGKSAVGHEIASD